MNLLFEKKRGRGLGQGITLTKSGIYMYPNAARRIINGQERAYIGMGINQEGNLVAYVAGVDVGGRLFKMYPSKGGTWRLTTSNEDFVRNLAPYFGNYEIALIGLKDGIKEVVLKKAK